MQQRVRRRRSIRRREVNHCIGSKSGLAMLPACFINPGDITLMTVPGYPVAGTHTALLRRLGLQAAAAGRERISSPTSTASPPTFGAKAKLLVLCFPNSPTGKTAPPEYYETGDRVCEEAQHRHPAGRGPRAAVVRSGAEQLPVDPGAMDVGVEMHSMSKGFDMIGWRRRLALRQSSSLVKAFADTKDNFDSGQFLAIQRAAIAGLDDPEIPKRIRAQVQAAAGEAGRHAQAVRLQVRDAGRHLLPLHADSPKGLADGPAVRERRGLQPVPHHASNQSAQCRGTMPGSFLRF